MVVSVEMGGGLGGEGRISNDQIPATRGFGDRVMERTKGGVPEIPGSRVLHSKPHKMPAGAWVLRVRKGNRRGRRERRVRQRRVEKKVVGEVGYEILKNTNCSPRRTSALSASSAVALVFSQRHAVRFKRDIEMSCKSGEEMNIQFCMKTFPDSWARATKATR